MSKTNGTKKPESDGTEAMLEPWLEYWMNLVEQNKDWVEAMAAGTPKNVDPRTVRKAWLGAMSKSVDAYLRTPAFLEGMRRNSETLAETKITTDLAQREWAREAGMPHAEDIRGLYERLETAHEVVLEKLSTIEKRLSAIERKVAAPASATAKKKKTATKKTEAKKTKKAKSGGKK